jgi:mannose-1-phosphate guanylyltransferase/mannose-6-phosphate isomerase
MGVRINIQPVILSGGVGSRLWPLSRSGFPKQFLSLTGDKSLFQSAAQRLAGLGDDDINVAKILVVSSDEQRFLVLKQLLEASVDFGSVILEPAGKNTAPALTLAALSARDSGFDPVLVVTPADQIIVDNEAFKGAIHSAVRCAESGAILMLGIAPDHAADGYGYIHASPVSEVETCSYQIYDVSGFVEKPDAVTAQCYLDAGGYFWNSGIFIVKTSVWLDALATFRSDIADATRLAWDSRTVEQNTCMPFVRPGEPEFMSIPAQSIDYAVMEHCPGSQFPVKMVTLEAGWNDLGSWDAVWQISPKDEDGNARHGDVLTVESHDTFAYATSRLVSLVGVDNLVIIESPDAVLVANKSCAQNVRQVVEMLHRSGREEQALHRKVHRPWGWYDTLETSERCKIKRIQVNSGASLSLQKHDRRSEHWIVVKGTAEVTKGERKRLLSENESIYIPVGTVHRLANPGPTPLEIIEVQYGDYLGEDDIVRLEDSYGR